MCGSVTEFFISLLPNSDHALLQSNSVERNRRMRAVSSAVERLPYKQDATGSNPVLPIDLSIFSAIFARTIELQKCPKISLTTSIFRDILGI